jgi:ketosteroid isomerase-like protein
VGHAADLVRSLYDAWNRRAFDELAEALAPAVEWHDVGRGETVRGRPATRALLSSLAESFPRACIDVVAVHEAAGVVVAELAFTRTAGGRWPRRPTACDVVEVEGGRVTRARSYADAVRTALDLGGDVDVPLAVIARVA